MGQCSWVYCMHWPTATRNRSRNLSYCTVLSTRTRHWLHGGLRQIICPALCSVCSIDHAGRALSRNQSPKSQSFNYTIINLTSQLWQLWFHKVWLLRCAECIQNMYLQRNTRTIQAPPQLRCRPSNQAPRPWILIRFACERCEVCESVLLYRVVKR
jgi:hypothetical protein